MKKEIVELQALMKRDGIDVYYVPSGDFHASEYFCEYFRTREFLSGLTGEAGTLVVTAEDAYLWTDSRVFLQAEAQLAGSGIELMRMQEPGVPTIEEFLTALADKSPYTLGFDGRVVPGKVGTALCSKLKEKGVTVVVDTDLAGEVWTDRTPIRPTRIYELPDTTTGMKAVDKIAAVRAEMKDHGADALLVSDLMENAWLFNLRGSDIDYTPVFFSYTLMTQDEVRLYVYPEALDPATPYSIPNYEAVADLIDPSPRGANGLPEALSFVKVCDYNDICEGITGLAEGSTVWFDPSATDYLLYQDVPAGVKVIEGLTPIAYMKAVKNPVEIEDTIRAQAKDGAALLKFSKWIKNVAGETPRQTELSASEYLKQCRFEQPGCFDLSFGAIMGYGPNGAIIHYAPTPETDAVIEPKGFLLLDSGGHYIDGTTDITRTYKVGPLTQEMIDDYTYVLKSHIAMGRFVIEPGMTGIDLDAATRAPMHAIGLDFKHGFSHGVGHLLSVHEGPNIIRRVPTPIDIRPGMIMSNEPGYYKDGEFGIRIENEVLWEDAGDGRVSNRMISYVPYEREAINKDLLTREEIDWIDAYHAEVRKMLEPLVSDDLKAYLEYATAPL
ncbi:MAG: M24 family metallopeptidase [Mogibacterium sp.]|nr:M24 family metallopeptidase [Mogibacterium sp.]